MQEGSVSLFEARPFRKLKLNWICSIRQFKPSLVSVKALLAKVEKVKRRQRWIPSFRSVSTNCITSKSIFRWFSNETKFFSDICTSSTIKKRSVISGSSKLGSYSSDIPCKSLFNVWINPSNSIEWVKKRERETFGERSVIVELLRWSELLPNIDRTTDEIDWNDEKGQRRFPGVEFHSHRRTASTTDRSFRSNDCLPPPSLFTLLFFFV